MDQLELFDLPNPCIGVCQSNNRGYCVGCLRSRDERFNWHQKPAAERARILKLLEQRRARRDAARLAGKPDSNLEADNTLFTRIYSVNFTKLLQIPALQSCKRC